MPTRRVDPPESRPRPLLRHLRNSRLPGRIGGGSAARSGDRRTKAQGRAAARAGLDRQGSRPPPGRETAVVVRELFARAEKTALIGGFRFDHGQEILAPLYRAMAERGADVNIFVHIQSGRTWTGSLRRALLRDQLALRPAPA